MYNIGDIFYLDENYSKIAEYCNEHKLAIVEIDSDTDVRKFKIEDGKYIQSEEEINKAELKDLKFWFDTYYSQHEQKYNRLIALNKLTDDGHSSKDALNALYLEAEIKRKRIQELEKLVNY